MSKLEIQLIITALPIIVLAAIGIIIILAYVHSSNKKAEERRVARYNALMNKYYDKEIVDNIVSRSVWMNQTLELY